MTENYSQNNYGVVRLTIFDEQRDPIEIDLRSFGKSVITFGRDPNNDIRLNSGYVSRRHGQIRLENGSCIVEDLGSSNGLIFNGKRITSKVLSSGDNVRIDRLDGATSGGVLMVLTSEEGVSWREIELAGQSEIVIGRDSSCDVVLDHVSISRNHAKVVLLNGEWHIVDNGSTNGVVVNRRKISGSAKLKEKDLILITNSKLIFANGKLAYCCFKKGISVEARHIVKRVDKGQKTICDDVTLNIEPCELVAIVGGSGAGKSTLMNCISGYSQPTVGAVTVNNVDLYENFAALKNIIGYVPQQDIVFDNLTVVDMLKYAARLRLPDDFTQPERVAVVHSVIASVELTEHKDKLIKNLSGGQKKRASIAVELLSDPNLFFLDEPASGLDPGTERNLMKTLKTMTRDGKTVIFVTHSTLNLHLCDKIVFMGAGGHLCFCGSYQEALRFFEVDDIVDVYNLITERPQVYKDKFIRKNRRGGELNTGSYTSEGMPKQTNKHSRLRQLLVLCKRNLHLMINDKVRLIMLLVQAPLLAFLISLVADDKQFEQYEITKSLLFAVSCSAFWIGMLNSIQEICKERNILKREYMTGLRLNGYVISKLIVMAMICAVQAFLLTSVFVLTVGQPEEGIVMPAYWELLLTTFLTMLAASATGIFVSSLFKNADRAMTVAPILLMPQLLFSGLIFKLEGASELISWIAACRFSMEAYGTTANLNNLQNSLQEQGFLIEREAETYYTFTSEHFAFALLMLATFVVVFSVAATIVLRNIKKEGN